MIDLNSFVSKRNCSYIDIPSYEFFESNEYTKGQSDFLKALKRYKSISKEKVDDLQARILMLSNLEDSICSEEEPFLVWTRDSIIKKRSHLEDLRKLFHMEILRDTKELYPPEVEAAFKTDNPNLLPLKNDLSYDAYNGVFFGMGILEAIDPAHRLNLTSFVEDWKKNSDLNFFMYLESRDIYNLIPQVKYFDFKQLKEQVIKINNNGLLEDYNGTLLDTDNREFLFVISKDLDFYGCFSSSRFKHTSLSGGNPVLATGTMSIRKGVITEMSANSGHYFPTLDNIKLAKQMFSVFGAKFADISRIKYFNGVKIETILHERQRG